MTLVLRCLGNKKSDVWKHGADCFKPWQVAGSKVWILRTKRFTKKKRLPYSSVQSLAGQNTEERRCLDGECIISLTQPGEEVHSWSKYRLKGHKQDGSWRAFCHLRCSRQKKCRALSYRNSQKINKSLSSATHHKQGRRTRHNDYNLRHSMSGVCDKQHEQTSKGMNIV